MKRAFLMILSMGMILSLAACGSSGGLSSGTPPAQQPESTQPDTSQPEEPQPSAGGGKTLVAYYSATGNTAAVAEAIARVRGGDLFEIVPAEPYSSDDLDWTDRDSRVSREHDDASLREMELAAGTVEDWDEYDTVFIGYPIWWSDLPQILYTFFDTYDFSGKTVIPFSTHGGSSFAGTPAAIQSLEPNAKLLEGLTISRDSIQDAEQEITDWVKKLGI